MDKKKAINLLKESLSQITKFKTTSGNNQEFKLWKDKIFDILETAFGKNSTEYNRFEDAFSHSLDNTEYENYFIELNMKETALKSIIQKYETSGIQPERENMNELPKVFISHGKGGGALLKLKKFVTELGVIPIIVKDQPNLDRTVDEKVEDCLGEADFVIIFATGDDDVAVEKNKITTILKQPRQNVIHEIGLAQKTHEGKIIYLLEEGSEFPSNIRPKVYESFARQSLDGAFIAIVREMKELGFLKVMKPESKE